MLKKTLCLHIYVDRDYFYLRPHKYVDGDENAALAEKYITRRHTLRVMEKRKIF